MSSLFTVDTDAAEREVEDGAVLPAGLPRETTAGLFSAVSRGQCLSAWLTLQTECKMILIINMFTKQAFAVSSM